MDLAGGEDGGELYEDVDVAPPPRPSAAAAPGMQRTGSAVLRNNIAGELHNLLDGSGPQAGQPAGAVF